MIGIRVTTGVTTRAAGKNKQKLVGEETGKNKVVPAPQTVVKQFGKGNPDAPAAVGRHTEVASAAGEPEQRPRKPWEPLLIGATPDHRILEARAEQQRQDIACTSTGAR